MLWIGLLLLVVGIVLFFVGRSQGSKVYAVKATETSRVGDVLAIGNEIAAEMPDGQAIGFSEYVELKGRVVCESPLRSDMSDQLGAIITKEVFHVFNERQERQNSDGTSRTTWNKREESVSNDRRESPFYLDDGSGRVLMRPERAIELEKTVDRFEPVNAASSGTGVKLSIGKFNLSLGASSNTADRVTLGYRVVEKMLPVNRQLYALGELAFVEGQGYVFRAPEKGNRDKPYIVSLKTEEDIVKGAQSNQKVVGIISKILGILGLGLTIYALIK